MPHLIFGAPDYHRQVDQLRKLLAERCGMGMVVWERSDVISNMTQRLFTVGHIITNRKEQ